MGYSDSSAGSAPANSCTRVALYFPSAVTLAAEATVRAEEDHVMVDLHFPDNPPFVNIVLTADAALDLSLKLTARVVDIRRRKPLDWPHS